ncbi:DUF1905 domain-containing protein [Caulobacter sp. DWR1-3-2b1]|uniref:DUF1905 domain-containing protein n=1 Tax=Caulobacter sp. DWR1-3-2b1 TaxID=2804670 RepID=UPI003CF3059C
MTDVDEVIALAVIWPAGSWIFAKINEPSAAYITFVASGRRSRFGSLRVEAKIGDTRWRTSLFPQKEQRGWLLPIKREVREVTGISVGEEVEILLRF